MQWATLGSVAITLLLLGAALHSVARDIWFCTMASCPRHTAPAGSHPSAPLLQELLANSSTSSDHKAQPPTNTSQNLTDTPLRHSQQAGRALTPPPAQQVRERLLHTHATLSQPARQGSPVQPGRGTDSMQQLRQQLRDSLKDWRKTKPSQVQGRPHATQFAPPRGAKCRPLS